VPDPITGAISPGSAGSYLRRRGVALVSAVTLCSCGSERADSAAYDASAETAAAPADSLHASQLVEAAESIVGFLRGHVEFERIRLADTVTLYLSPEGGGGRTEISRDDLDVPSRWRVATDRGAIYSLVPPSELSQLTTRVGSHFNCLEYPLASRFPDLAELPHVGTRLEADGTSSCLQTWNLTLVFDPDERPPRLIAAIYDQWEW
jgi:hypothetical protein